MSNKNTKTIIWTGTEKEITFNKVLDKRGEEIILLMLLLGKKDKNVSVRVRIKHNAPETSSRVIVKGVLFDNSRVDFDGLVKIEKGAKNANAWLEARLLLLSDKASGRVEPNLEIAENEVKAGHGATVGKVSEEELFYLMSRGISEDAAKNLIVQGFLETLMSQMETDITDKIKKQLKWTT